MNLDITSWGPLSQPVHGPVPDGRPAWKDNAYLSFWDQSTGVYGVFHASTSPNAEGRRARFSLSAHGNTFEVFEPLEPGTLSSESIKFDFDRTIEVSTPRVKGTIVCTPDGALADYSKAGIIPELVAGEPLQHFQQAARVTGHLNFDGRDLEVDGGGFRDRTWGYRDESANMPEYVAVLAKFDDYSLTSMTFRDNDGKSGTAGFILTDEFSLITRMGITRDASGLFFEADLDAADSSELLVRNTGRLGGFWVPMGWTRKGPTMSAYDEFDRLIDGDGREGIGFVEQAITRMIY
jgi:hypothetical protein